jgi:Ca2+-binding RTX toxin-like protein
MDYIGATSGGDSSVTISGRGNFASSASIGLRGDDVTLNFSGLTGSTNAVIVSASALTGKATVSAGSAAASITGGGYNDVLTGGSGADSLVGGAGNDTIAGGSGVDTMTGGTGNDTFTLSATTSSDAPSLSSGAYSISSVDRITDFAASDVISFSSLSTTIASSTATVATDNKIVYVLGTLSSTTFTVDATATDSTTGVGTLVIWDTDSTVGTSTYKAVYLVGYVNVLDAPTYTGIVATGS